MDKQLQEKLKKDSMIYRQRLAADADNGGPLVDVEEMRRMLVELTPVYLKIPQDTFRNKLRRYYHFLLFD